MKTIRSNQTGENYYKAQLQSIPVGDDALKYISGPQFKISHEAGETKWMQLNKESAKVLVDWLKENKFI
jgi:hypothetical protein